MSEFGFSRRSDLSLVRHKLFPESELQPPDFRCLNQSLELRLSDPFDGRFFCGSDLRPGSLLLSDSTNVTIILHDFSKEGEEWRQRQQPQLKIEVDFVSDTRVTVNPPSTSTSVAPDVRPSITTPTEGERLLFSVWNAVSSNPLLSALRGLKQTIMTALVRVIPTG